MSFTTSSPLASPAVPSGLTTLAVLLMILTDVHSLGLQTAQGLSLSETYYWDLNDRTRALANKLKGPLGGAMPSMWQAGCYSAALHYLKAVSDMGAAA